ATCPPTRSAPPHMAARCRRRGWRASTRPWHPMVASSRSCATRVTAQSRKLCSDRRLCKHLGAPTGIPPIDRSGQMGSAYKLLQLALAVFGVLMLLLYPLSMVWPSGWLWHAGAPYESDYFMMIVGVYATLGIFLLNAARNPENNLSLIWFT